MGQARQVVRQTTRIVRRRGSADRPAQELAATMALALLVGAAVGGAAVAVDRVWLTPPPFELGTLQSVRSLLAALAGGLITIAVFSLWMRTVVVGLVSGHFSPRTLVGFLEDRFQRHLLGAMVAGLMTVLVVLLGLPAETDQALAPVVGTLVSVVIAVTALAGVLWAIEQATRSLSLSELVSRLANEAMAVLERQPEGTVELQRSPHPTATRAVTAPATGWVVSIDTAAMLAALPPGGVARLRTRVGAFVTDNDTVAEVSLAEAEDGGSDETGDLDAIAAAVGLARTRRPDVDLGLALGQLLDVGAHALQGSTDTATGHEVLVHLGAVLEAVVSRGLPLRHDADANGRWVIDEGGWDAADHVQLCAERLRQPAARDPASARDLLQLLGRVRDVAERVDDRMVVSEVGRQVETLVALAEANGMLERDLRHLERIAEVVLDGDPHV